MTSISSTEQQAHVHVTISNSFTAKSTDFFSYVVCGQRIHSRRLCNKFAAQRALPKSLLCLLCVIRVVLWFRFVASQSSAILPD